MIMRRRSTTERKILFPWERRGGLVRRLGLHRARPLFFALCALGLAMWVGMRERERTGVRRTRALIADVRRSIDAYMADHDGQCPPSLEVLLPELPGAVLPRDAWGRPISFRCPGYWDTSRYELISDGPDGLPGGLDRIE